MIVKHTVIAATCLLTASSAMAGNGWYMSVDLGVQVPAGDVSHAGTNSANTPTYDLDESAVGGLAVGYFINDMFRVEAEARFRNQEPEGGYLAGKNGRASESFNMGGDVDTTTVMANLIYQFSNSTSFTPYLKGGIGLAYSDVNANLDIQPTFTMFGLTDRWQYPDNDETNFAWSIGLGCDYSLTDNILVGLEYQYIDMGDISTGVDINGDRIDYDLRSHEITVGLTYLF